MAMTPGTRLGPYEVTCAIGSGGMGEVYRARDTKLGRDVAIKILPEPFAHDPERLARFEREAQTLAALNHPHIAQIHGLEEAHGIRALVMELVEGLTLADRIAGVGRTKVPPLQQNVRGADLSGPPQRQSARGAGLPGLPIPLEEALTIAKQIAEALEAAHEHGIIHRDLKPANIKVKDDGTVKVLDFGLAKALDPAGGAAAAGAIGDSPTITSPAAMTHQGVILGTAAYMPPEQAKGRAVDKRADIWAFGCVLFEILTGKRAFDGEDVSETLASVLKADPDWGAVPSTTPSSIRRLLRRCLEKDRKRRLDSIADARLEIEDALTTPATDIVGAPAPRRLRWWQRPLTIAAAALIAGAIVAGVAVWRVPRPISQRPVRFTVSPGAAEAIYLSPGQSDLAISPDGQRIVYMASTTAEESWHLEMRTLDQLAPAKLGVTGQMIRTPFFSPDGDWIGFYDGAGPGPPALKKVPVRGGPPVTICGPTGTWRGATWGPDDTIIFATLTGGLWQVPVGGGEPKRLTTTDSARGELGHAFPDILPGGGAVVFTIIATPVENSSVAVLKLATGEQTVLVRGGTSAKYVSTGHLVYAVQGTLRAVGFDPVRLKVLTDPVPLLEGVVTKASGAASFDIAANGSLVYATGGSFQAGGRSLVWVDRQGHEERVGAALRIYHVPRVSPDGSRVVVHTDDDGEIWNIDFARGTSTRLTFDPASDTMPLWTPDGKRIVFRSDRDGGGLFSTSADGTGEAEPIATQPVTQVPMTWSRDGTLLVVVGRAGKRSDSDIGIVPMEGQRSVKWLLQTRFQERRPAISPDGRWMAYDSDESGRMEVYVRPFPNVNEGRWQVSVDGGMSPLWSRDGQELFYARSQGALGLTMFRVPLQVAPRFSAGKPDVLFEGAYVSGFASDHRMHDLAPDGRFVLVSTQSDASAQLIVVVNWVEELKRLVAAGR